MIKATILSGSSRENNITIRVAQSIQQLLINKGHEASVVDFRNYDMPFFNGDEISIKEPTPFQNKLLTEWDSAKMVIMVSPEYNWFPSAELVNMLHQLGSPGYAHLFDNKVFSFVGVSTGRGGRLPAMQLSGIVEKLISHLHCYSFCSPAKFESHYSKNELDENGVFLLESQYRKLLEGYVDYNLALTLKFR